MAWQISSQPDDTVLHDFLVQNAIAHVYGLNDLHAPYRIRTRFWLAQQGNEWAVLMVYRTTTFTALVPFGHLQGIAAILEIADGLPLTCIVSSDVPEARAILGTKYRVGREETWVRTVVHRDAFKRYKNEMNQKYIQLTSKDIGDMAAFYTMNNVPTFSPDQVFSGVYYGIRRHGVLVAVGGTHFINKHDKIGAVGNVYTDPALRGNGYVRLIISELTKALFDQGCDLAIHDVKYNDYATRQIYEPLGFENSFTFWEATARMK